MDWTAKTVTQDDKEAVQAATTKALVGNPVVVSTQLYEVTNRPDYNERIFVIIWLREESRENGRDYGTHRACINDQDETMLVIGHYDLTLKEALTDQADRMKHAPAARQEA